MQVTNQNQRARLINHGSFHVIRSLGVDLVARQSRTGRTTRGNEEHPPVHPLAGEYLMVANEAKSHPIGSRITRPVLSNTELDLNGPECVLLGSFHKHLEDVELLDTRGLNIWLDSYGRKPSNTTSTVENLEKKGLMEFVAGENLNAHKTFRLTEAGRNEVRTIMSRLARKSIVSAA